MDSNIKQGSTWSTIRAAYMMLYLESIAMLEKLGPKGFSSTQFPSAERNVKLMAPSEKFHQ